MTYKFLGGLAVVGAALATAAGPASAARVSVEIEGQNVIQAPTVVDTAASVSKPGGAACSGAVPATALETAVAGDWDGGQYSVNTIKGEDRPFAPGASSWAVYVNDAFMNGTVCDADNTLKDGDKVLFFWSDAFATEGYDEPVVADAPSTVVPGQAFTVTAKDLTTDFNQYPSPPSVPTPAAGAVVSGGVAPATAGADGTARVTVGAAGPFTLVVTHDNRAPARLVGCATTGSDGACGTTKAAPAPGTPTTPAGAPDKTAALGRVTAIAEGRKFAAGKGPRQLAGKVDAEVSGLADVSLRLTRNDGGKCATYDGKTEKFKSIKKCGATHGTWFSVGKNANWSYLLPSKLARGRYVLDVQVTDGAGNKTAQLYRGTSRVVFTVA